MVDSDLVEIAKGVYHVGVRDWNRRVFDALIPLPRGTSYNSYLVIGSSGKALIDTVNPGFEKELEKNISSIVRPEEIDFIVMNHAEPDHAGAIPYMMEVAPGAKLVTGRVGKKMAQTFYRVPEERIRAVADNESISLGDKTLRFIEAPMLHWPETMFTYLVEDGVLFSCDFFGAHLAGAAFSDEIDDWLTHAKKYWAEIMMPFRSMAQKALEKIIGLDVRVIAPSHGPVHREPKLILSAYKSWASGETKPKVTIIYVSMWGSTETMIKRMIEALASENIELAVHNLAVADLGELAKDLADSRAIVLGAPTFLGGAHPLAVYAAYILKILHPPVTYAAILSSYGWGGGAVKQIQEMLSGYKIELVGALEVNGPLTENDVERITELGKALARKIQELERGMMRGG